MMKSSQVFPRLNSTTSPSTTTGFDENKESPRIQIDFVEENDNKNTILKDVESDEG